MLSRSETAGVRVIRINSTSSGSNVAVALALILGYGLVGVPQAGAQQTGVGDWRELETQIHPAVKRSIPTVVAIQEADTGRSLGAGVLISADGLVLSQYHVTHSLDPANPTRGVREPEDDVGVILWNGVKCKGQLLGADRTFELSLLRIVEPGGPFPHAAIDETVTPSLGDFVLKLGHPGGYRTGRNPAVRLGRVLCAQEHLFATDCLVSGGDSGGPYFDLDGRLIGMVHAATIPDRLAALPTERSSVLNAATTNLTIQSRLDSMLNHQISSPKADEIFGRFQEAENVVPPNRWSHAFTTREALGGVVQKGRASVVGVRDERGVVALGTVVGAEGLVVTKASELPAKPRCELPDGRIVEAEVFGMVPRLDIALLKVTSDALRPIHWAADAALEVGRFVVAPRLDEASPHFGIVSVSLRDQQGPFPSKVRLPKPEPAAIPEVIGSAVQGRGYWVEFVDGAAAEAGICRGDVLLTIGDHEIRGHEDLAGCVQGHWAGNALAVSLLRAGSPDSVLLRLRGKGQSPYSPRYYEFPSIFEHDALVQAHELGGPVVDPSGACLGVNIARAPHGCAAIPVSAIQSVLPELKSGGFAEQWEEYREALLDRQAQRAGESREKPAVGEPVTISLDQLKQKLEARRERFHSLLVEYEVVAEPHVHPKLLMSWNLQLVRDYREVHRIAFSGDKRLSEVTTPSFLVWNMPRDRVHPDPNAPPSVAQAVEQMRLRGIQSRREGRTSHFFRQLPPAQQRKRYICDGEQCFRWDSLQKRMKPISATRFHQADMYLSGLGLRPRDPQPAKDARQAKCFAIFPDLLSEFRECRILPNHEVIAGSPCILVEGKSDAQRGDKSVERTDQIWLDSSLGFAPRRWTTHIDGHLIEQRQHSDFEELDSGCWLPWHSTWTFFTPLWTRPDMRAKPAYSFKMRLRRVDVNDGSDEVFEP